MFSILIERGRADQMQFASGQHGLEQIGGVHRPFRCTGPYNGMQLVDEKQNLSLGRLHFFEDGFQSFLKLTTKLRAGHQRSHVESDDAFLLQPFRHIPFDDTGWPALRQWRFSQRPARR